MHLGVCILKHIFEEKLLSLNDFLMWKVFYHHHFGSGLVTTSNEENVYESGLRVQRRCDYAVIKSLLVILQIIPEILKLQVPGIQLLSCFSIIFL